MKNTGLKRLLSAILSLAMVLSAMPMPALAEDVPQEEDAVVIYYDNSASSWEQVFVGWTDPHTDSSEMEEIFDANTDGLYEVRLCKDSTGLSFGPSADLSQHLLWLDSVTGGGVYRYIPPVEEEPTEPEVTEEPTEPEVTEEPTEPEVTEEPTEPEVTEEPTEPEVTEEPTEPEVTEEPTEPVHEHEYTSAVTAPTCTEQGFTTYTCACGDSYADDYTDALGHDLGDWITDREATCTEDGSKHKECSRCDYTETETIDAGHDYVDGICDLCGEAEAALVAEDDLIASGTCGTDLTWELDANGVLTISGSGPMTAVPWNSYCTQITAVTVDNGVTSISGNAFNGCYNLTGITIGDDVTSIGASAFSDCRKLTAVTLPNGVITLETYAFLNCESLTAVTLPNSIRSIGFGAFFGCRSLTGISIPAGVTVIEDHTFSDCQSLTSVTLPDSLTSIGYGAFFGCYELTEISIPANVTSIGERAFGQCFALTDISIPSGVTSIGASTFYDCRSLTSITIPATATSISSDAFYGCNSIVDVFYGGTADRWAALSNTPSAAYVHYSCTGWETVTTTPTCTEAGSSKEVCACGYERNITELDAAGHTEVIDERVEPSCTETGLTEGKHCSVCGTVTLAQEVIPAGHSFSDNVCTVCGLTVGTCGEGLTWTLDTEGTLTISGNGPMEDYAASDAPWYSRRSEITDIVITDGVTSIGDYSFYFCSNLAAISIPDGVTSIGDYAFYYCSSLTAISIPDGVTSIGNSAFCSCGFAEITIPASVTSIGPSAFSLCSLLTAITIPEGITRISKYAFQNCYSLTAVSIPSSVTSIDNSAFVNCSDLAAVFYKGTESQKAGISTGSLNEPLTSATWHYEVTEETHDGQLCYRCGKCGLLYTADGTLIPEGPTWTLENGVLTISGNGPMEDYAADTDVPWYSQRTSVTSVVIGEGITSIGDKAFFGCNLQNITVPDSVTSIGEKAFFSCIYLTGITLPDGVTSIGDKAFYGCTSLADISMPDSVTSIGESAFYMCGSLTDITLPKGITSISHSMFGVCIGLTTVIIPEGVTSIGSYAFESCSGLKSITVPDSVTEIGRSTFLGCSSLKSITIPDGITSIDSSTFYGCSSLSSITIPDGVTGIGSSAFKGCSSLTSITIPDSVTSIGSYAFQGCCSLTSVTIPASVTSIRADAFTGCSNVEDVFYGGTADQWAALNNSPEADFVHYSCPSGEGHWETVTTKPTCTEAGSTRDVCACGYERNIKETVPSNDAHRFANGTCTRCGIPGGYCGSYLTWMLKDGVLTISRTGPMTDYSTSGAPWYPYRAEITSVVINDGVTSIGDYAFADCSSLTGITIPASVTAIGDYAFQNCSGLTAISIPDSVSAIGDYAFQNCSGLTAISIPDRVTSIRERAFSGCSSLTSVTIGTGVTSIWSYAFFNCSSLTSITIPDSVTAIARNVFTGCTSLASVTIGNGLTRISDWMFYNCTGLTSITIGDRVTSIGASAFRGCSSLKNITIPDSVTSIGDYAFEKCSGLTSVTIPNSVTSIGSQAFAYCSSLTSVTIPSSITSIGYGMFSVCTSLESITIPNSVTSIGRSAFYSCSSLTDITIPDGVTSIGYEAFRYCVALSSITIGNGVTSIGSYAFEDCSSLENITIPNSVTSIGEYAFSGCSGMTGISVSDSITSIAEYTFNKCSSLTGIAIPDGVTSIGERAFKGCSSLKSISIPASITGIDFGAFEGCSALTDVHITDVAAWLRLFSDSDNACPLYANTNAHTLYLSGKAVADLVIPDGITSIPACAFYYCTGLTSVTIPDSVTDIGNGAFRGCSSLASITIPDSVTSIGSTAFADCSSLTSVTISNSVTRIGGHAFYECSSLTSVTIPDSVTSIGSHAFYECSSLTDVYITDIAAWLSISFEGFYSHPFNTGYKANTLYLNGEVVTELVIPNGVTNIPAYSFFYCTGLTSVTIPDSVTSIGEDAFWRCDGIEDMFYGGTADQWAALSNTPSATFVHDSCASGEDHWETVTTAPTCTEAGSTRDICPCGYERNIVRTEAVGHSYVDGICDLCGESDPSALQAPTVTVSNVASSGKIKLTWNAVPGAVKYDVYRSTGKNGTYTLLKTLTGTQLTNTSVTVGTTYYYYVVAVTEDGLTSPQSNTVSRTCDLARPSATVSIVASSGKPKISWNAVSGATKYTLYIYDAEGALLKSSTTTGTSITHSSAVAGASYTYKVKALCSVTAAASAYSVAKTVTCDLARPTLTVSNVASTGKIKLTWGKVTGATKYTLYIYDAEGTLLKTSSTTGTSITHSSAVAGASYTYKVKALCSVSAATSALSEARSRTCDLARPSLSVTNVASTGKIKLTWNKITGATKYTLYIYDAEGTLLKTSSTTGTSITHSSAVAGASYTYQVKALCSVSAAASAISEAKSRTCDLARPTLSAALNANGKPVLTWNAVSGAVKYTLYIYDADGDLLKTTNTTGTKLTHSSAATGTAYSYRVVAVSSISAANSVQSAAVSVTAG